jgi:2-oxoglutarate ferredoxin oxidoreductase subunit beta
VYVVENNCCYGLTKGQFSATADLNAPLLRPGGEQNTVPPFDLCLEAIAAGASFVARSFAGDRKQLLPLLKAGLHHRGTVLLDIISPCVTFNDFEGSTKSWDWAKEHEEPLHEIGFVQRLEEIEVEQVPGKPTQVKMHDGSVITLRALHHEEHDVRNRSAAMRLLVEGQEKGEFITGLLYIAPERPDFIATQNMVDTPLARLPDSALRPGPAVLEAIMAEL